MKRLLLLLAGLLCCTPTWAQGSYYSDYVVTSATNVPVGAQAPIYTLPQAQIFICAYPAASSPCTNFAAVYADQALTMQLTPPLIADVHGRYSFWAASGLYSRSVVTAGGTNLGTYPFTVGGSGGGVTYLQAGAGIAPITGSGTSGSPYVIGVATTFTINSFTGCNGSLELGASITNPICTATYSATPASATITNTDGTSSPFTMTTPFTSATIPGTFTHSTTATTTFTLTAVGSTTQTATQAYTWKPRIFGGVGATGATATVTASGTNAVLSTGSVLASLQLGSEAVGQSLGSYTPSGQNVYLLLTGGSHTFVDSCTGFPFAFNAPVVVSFTNVNGTVVPLWLYTSTNPLTYTSGCAFTPKVAS